MIGHRRLRLVEGLESDPARVNAQPTEASSNLWWPDSFRFFSAVFNHDVKETSGVLLVYSIDRLCALPTFGPHVFDLDQNLVA